jgi:hypothetical protein
MQKMYIMDSPVLVNCTPSSAIVTEAWNAPDL